MLAAKRTTHTHTHTHKKKRTCERVPPSQPATVVRKMKAQSEYVHVAHTSLHVWRRIACSGRCLSTKISASELARKFIKRALLVGLGDQHLFPLFFLGRVSRLQQKWELQKCRRPLFAPVSFFSGWDEGEEGNQLEWLRYSGQVAKL